MSKTLLNIVLIVMALFLSAGAVAAEDAASLVVPSEAGNAYLFQIADQTYLVGMADQASILAQLQDAHVHYVVCICDHSDHMNAAETLAETLSAKVLHPEDAQDVLTWQNGALLIGGYAFSVKEHVDGFVTMDCQGSFLSFQGSTSMSAVNVRATPTTKGKRVEKLNKGAVVTVVGQVENDTGETWFKVVLDNGEEGYVRSDLLNVGEAVAAVATPSPSNGEKDERYVGNKNSKVFHRPGCEHLPKGRNAVYFSTRSYAVAKGYRPCEHCDP